MPTFSSTQPRHAHIVTIRSPDGDIVAYQLRFDGGGPGNSAYYPAQSLGGVASALEAARTAVRALGLPEEAALPGMRHRHRSRVNNTGYAGIRFVWSVNKGGSVTLSVLASWIERDGRKNTTRYSVERWGLDGALDRAIARRTASGAVAPDRVALLGALMTEYRRGTA